jgi:hypothetical protein
MTVMIDFLTEAPLAHNKGGKKRKNEKWTSELRSSCRWQWQWLTKAQAPFARDDEHREGENEKGKGEKAKKGKNWESEWNHLGGPT